jgi:prepilin-type N-terminal cleavage/methylation domain-containing protein
MANPVVKGIMPILSAGATNRSSRRLPQRGITLIEMLIVMTLIALVAGLSYPSAASGVESLRLRSVSDSVVSFLNTAIDRASRREQVVEVWIAPKDNVMIARSPDLAFSRRLEIPDTFHITAITPAAEVAPGDPRRFLLYPGAAAPSIGIEITNNAGRKRRVTIDPLTSLPRAVWETP